MKGCGTSILPIDAGIKHDLTKLLSEFVTLDKYSLEAFSELYARSGMGDIAMGRQSAAELMEFFERLLQISIGFVCQTYTGDDQVQLRRPDLERVFGIYTTYVFFYTQVKVYVVQIKVTPNLVEQIHQLFISIAHREIFHDAAMCILKLIGDGAFKVVNFESAFDPMWHKRYEPIRVEGEATASIDVEEPYRSIEQILKSNFFQDTMNLSNIYEDCKKNFKCVTKSKLDVNAYYNNYERCASRRNNIDRLCAMLNADMNNPDSDNKTVHEGVKETKQRAYCAKVPRLKRFGGTNEDYDVQETSDEDEEDEEESEAEGPQLENLSLRSGRRFERRGRGRPKGSGKPPTPASTTKRIRTPTTESSTPKRRGRKPKAESCRDGFQPAIARIARKKRTLSETKLSSELLLDDSVPAKRKRQKSMPNTATSLGFTTPTKKRGRPRKNPPPLTTPFTS